MISKVARIIPDHQMHRILIVLCITAPRKPSYTYSCTLVDFILLKSLLKESQHFFFTNIILHQQFHFCFRYEKKIVKVYNIWLFNNKFLYKLEDLFILFYDEILFFFWYNKYLFIILCIGRRRYRATLLFFSSFLFF